MSDGRGLTEAHRKVLTAWQFCHEDFGCLTFNTIASNSGVERSRIRRIVRHLARKGMTEFHRGLWTEDGMPAGSGYAITAAGRATLAERGGSE